MSSERDAHLTERVSDQSAPTGLQLLLDALHAAAEAGDAEAARMLRILQQSVH